MERIDDVPSQPYLFEKRMSRESENILLSLV